MLPERSLKADFAAVVLLAVSAFFALALLTFDPADAPSRLVSPPNASVHNLCGTLGAWSAAWLYRGLGLGAYYVVLSLGLLAGCMISGAASGELLVRSFGWLMSLAGFAMLATLAAVPISPGAVIGPGGYLGAALGGLVELHCARAGAYILSLSFIAAGLLLSCDDVLLRLTGAALGRLLRLSSAMLRAVAARPVRRRAVADSTSDRELDGEDDSDEEQIEVPIKRRTTEREGAQGLIVDSAGGSKSDAEPVKVAAPAVVEPEGEPEEVDGVRIRAPQRSDRQAVLAELDAASRVEPSVDYELPPLDLLLDSEPFSFDEQEKDVRRKAKILEKTFANFGFKVRVVEVETGPVIAQFEVELEAGLRLSKITGLSEDLAIALRVPSVRIVAPIPGKNTVGIEVPNAERQLVRLREVIDESNGKAAKMRIPIYLGKDVSGKTIVVDLATLPHLLIAGRTGTGKSVCLNTIIMSMLMTRRPDDVRMLLIDPKMVELSSYMKLPHLMHPVVTDMRKAEAILGWAVEKMEERYALLARAGVRHISVYNQLGEEELFDRLQPETDEERKLIPTHLPYIVIVADEMADLMMTAAKEVEAHIIRLAQKSRAVGIHLVLATQKPTVDVITGLIKSNLPARISFQVASRTDSRVVLDEMGADKLLGNGDMLFLWPGTSTLLRGQGAYVSDDEISRVVEFTSQHEPQFVNELIQLKPASSGAQAGRKGHDDDLFEAAVDIVIREGRGSVSLLQRALGIGYGRAARLIDYMAEDGIVGQYNGSQAREVLISLEQWQEMCGQGDEPRPATSARPLPGVDRKAGAAPRGPSRVSPAAVPRRKTAGAATRASVNRDDGEDEEADADPVRLRVSHAERDWAELDEDDEQFAAAEDRETGEDEEQGDDQYEDQWDDSDDDGEDPELADEDDD
jgi:S-DNA-T family DNA segregation ATPase FtsK/SpoIIIE